MVAKTTFHEFKERSERLHAHKYTYYEADYHGAPNKTRITCPVHGDFFQTPKDHLSGSGCRKCGTEIRLSVQKKKFEDFEAEARSVHGNTYMYSESDFTGSSNKTRVTCMEHGDFWQLPSNHLKGHNCPVCGEISRRRTQSLSFDTFREKALLVHGDTYEYTKEGYTIGDAETTIVCKTHGEFQQNAIRHLTGVGCPKCGDARTAKAKLKPIAEFLQQVKIKHGNKYTYDELSFTKVVDKLTVICPKHGAFRVTGANHLQGCGCPKCAHENISLANTIHFDEFMPRATEVHGNRYKYSEGRYRNLGDLVGIECPKHGIFYQRGYSHLEGYGCRKCSNNGTSKWEQEMLEWLKPFAPEHQKQIQLNGLKVRKNKLEMSNRIEIDVYLPQHKVGIEANGLYWHSEDYTGEHYHQDKLKVCNENGIDLIQVYEDEWRDKRPIIESIILTRIGVYQQKIFARKTKRVPVTADQAREFYDANHIQGYIPCETHHGLMFEGTIVAMASFGKRKHLFNSDTIELIRFCTQLNTQVVGGLSKLIKGFSKLRTYCDLRLFNGSGYKSAGFKEVSISKPRYCYVKNGHRFSRYAFQKHKLKDKLSTFDPTLTEVENMALNGYNRIFNCGNMVLEI